MLNLAYGELTVFDSPFKEWSGTLPSFNSPVRVFSCWVSFRRWGLALFSSVFEVGVFVVGSHDHYLPAFLLEFSNISIAEFRPPFESLWVITFHIIERAMRMKSRHVLAELVNMPFHYYARLTLRLRCIGFGSLRVTEG